MAAKMPTKRSMNKVGDYSLIPKFPGYHAREDPTTLPVGTLVSPSQNVVIKTSGRVALVDGYVLDGTGSAVIDSGILSNYDFINFKGDTRNLRAGFMSAAGNDGKLQYRYVDATGTVNWVNLATSLTNIRLSYCTYWDNTALVNLVTWVDGSDNVFQWNGAVTTFAAADGNTVISFVGNNALLTIYGRVIGTSTFTNATNGGLGTSLLAYVGLTVQPTNGQTLELNINGGVQLVTFVSVIGSTAGNVLIGVNLAATIANLLGALQSPATTSATQVAFSSPNQTILGYITFASNNNTITNQGSLTWAEQGFSTAGSIVIGGVAYTYAGGGYSNMLFGVSSNLSATAVASIIHQAVVVTPLSSMTGMLETFGPTVVGCGVVNQLYLGTSNSNSLYISKNDNFLDYTFSTPRVAGDGALKVLQAPPVAFIAQESIVSSNTGDTYDMYISQGQSFWSIIRLTVQVTSASDGTQTGSEQLDVITLKAAILGGAQSGRLAGKMKNHLMFIANDNVANFLGWISFQYVPETVDFSYPIIDDMNSYDFTDASIYYQKNYIYIAIPKEGIIRVYNMTDQTKQTTMSTYHPYEDVDVANQPWFWEAPITYPVSGFYYTPDKGLCAHSYTTSESYQIFTGGSLNGQDIEANATFAYDDKGDRTQTKGSTELYVEGYIQQNTELTATVTGDLDTFAVSQTVVIDGGDTATVAFGGGAHSLGKNNLGSQPLGGANTVLSTLPAWFHVIKTYDESPFYLEQISFSTKGVDLDWELITWGTDASFTNEGNNSITE